MKEHRNDAFSQLLDWLENGDSALETEMEDALKEEEELDPVIPEAESQDVPETEPKREETNTVAPKTEKRRFHADTWWYRLAAAAICIALIGLMMFAAVRMPDFGGADTLVDSEVSRFYVENTLKDTGATNIVTGIILDYRGFDTLGETHVLFIAACTVLLILSVKGEKYERQRLIAAALDQRHEPNDDLILQSAARILTPVIFLFGLYIIFNGHLSPGGGFSGGAVLGAGLILFQNAFGYEKTERFFTYKTFRWVSVTALLFYSLAKGWHFFTGANGMENGLSNGTAGNIFSAGLLLPLNIAVGCVVACVMYALYTMFRKGEF